MLKNRASKKAEDFSFKIWGMKTDQYVDSICNLSEDEWDAILEGAQSYLGRKTGKVQGGESNEENNNPFPIFASDDKGVFRLMRT